MAGHPITVEVAHNPPVFTVSEISHALKRLVEREFDRVRVRGEIGGLRRAGSGHCYFTLKDADAALDAVCWRVTVQSLAVAPEDGLEVIVTGRLTTFPARSRYQIVVEAIEAAGQGALLKLLEERRQRLAAEGLFDSARKRPLPYLPEVIGVVTSPSGAVLHDILHRLAERFPRRVIVWPVLVQGQGAAEQIAAAIEGFNRLPGGGTVPRPDVLIVARGGGSLEDLWPFNEEIVCRAAAASAIPLISAVGHETDTTLIDFAADRRAPTPTAAAEIVVPVRLELTTRLQTIAGRLGNAVSRGLNEHRTRLAAAARGLPRPERLCAEARQRLDDLSERLGRSLPRALKQRQEAVTAIASRLVKPAELIQAHRAKLAAEGRLLAHAVATVLTAARVRLQHAAALLDSLSYERVLDRGFALIFDRSGGVITSVETLRPGLGVTLRLADGSAEATIGGDTVPPARKQKPTRDPGQGTLL